MAVEDSLCVHGVLGLSLVRKVELLACATLEVKWIAGSLRALGKNPCFIVVVVNRIEGERTSHAFRYHGDRLKSKFEGLYDIAPNNEAAKVSHVLASLVSALHETKTQRRYSALPCSLDGSGNVNYSSRDIL